MLYDICMNDQQDCSFQGSDGVPSLFAGHNAVLSEDCMRIVENERCGLEGDAAMLPLVDPVLFGSHANRIASLYEMYNETA